MKMIIKTADNIEHEIKNITRLTFSQSADAACDSVWAYFKSENVLGEAVSVRLFDGARLIFNGYCDCQKITEDKDGFKVYIFARSGAALLVDNQAEPYTYFSPSGKQLCLLYAKPFGIECALPEIYSSESYQVSGSTSCYGAINQFVYFCTGYSIAVTPENELCLLTPSNDIKHFDDYTVLSVKSTINRSEPISIINYKDSFNAGGYGHHTRSDFADSRQINRCRYVNLNSLAPWQRDYTVLQRLKKSFDEYMLLELELAGYADEKLLQRFSFSSRIGNFDDYALVEKRYICDENGSRTKLTLRKMIDVKENTYVD